MLESICNRLQETQKSVSSFYNHYQNVDVTRMELMLDEASAYYAEEILGTDAAIDLLLGKKKTLKEKILSFFKGAARDYAGDAALSKEARKFLRTFKKMFDAFAEKNQSVKVEKSEGVNGNVNEVNKNVDNEKAINNANIRAAIDDAYSYDMLIKKDPLNVVYLSGTIPMTEDGNKFNNKRILEIGRHNAKSQNNKNNTATSTYVHVKDIGVDVLIGSKGMQHGLERNDEATARAVMHIGDILANSVSVNEMNPSAKRNTQMSYVLLTACEFDSADYVVRSVVSKEDNSVSSFDLYKLGAVKGKKIDNPNSALKRGAAVTGQGPLISSGYPIISITDFLENVKSIPMINEVLSDDVAKKLGITRSKGSLSPDLRYSMDEEPKFPRTAGTMSIGQYKQRVADLTKTKSYMKNQVYDIVKKLPMADMASEKTRMQATEAVWQIFNEKFIKDSLFCFGKLGGGHSRIILEFF